MFSEGDMESGLLQMHASPSGKGHTTSSDPLAQINDDMFKRRVETNPQALTMEFWKDHFAKLTACESELVRGSVLDIGCGTGEIDIWLARTKPDVKIIGLDVSPVGLGFARENLQKESDKVRNRISFIRSIGEHLPFKDSQFDCCFTSHTLEHVHDHTPLFQELSRVLKPEGFVVIVVPYRFFHDDPTHVWHFDSKSLQEHLSLYGDDVEVWKSPDGQQLAAKLRIRKRRKIIGMCRIKNEEKWIGKVLEKASPIVDGFIILDDGSTDRTEEICGTFPNVLRYEKQHLASVDEARDKNKLLKLALPYNPDWILALDGDEVLEDAAATVVPKLLEVVPDDVTVIGFDFLYMWDSDERYRFDGKYRGINHPRLFRVSGNGIDPDALLFKSTQHGSNFHCGSVPSNMPGRVFQSDIKVKHYGYFEEAQRKRKKEFYVRHDPDHASQGYYDHLTDEKGIQLFNWKERSPEEVVSLRSVGSGAQKPHTEDTEELQRKFNSLPQYYKHLRKEILNAVPVSANSILDVGCGAGVLGSTLKAQRPGRKVTGIELDPAAFFFACRNLDSSYNVDAESFTPPFGESEFDCIVFADILEHLKDPWGVVRKYARFLKENGTVVISIPNIRYLSIVRDLAEFGKWEYQDEGILDRTHLRFFTKQEFMKLLSQAGIACQSVTYLGTEAMQPYRPQDPARTVRIGNLEIHNVSDEIFDELSAFQILFIGTRVPRMHKIPGRAIPHIEPAVGRSAKRSLPSEAKAEESARLYEEAHVAIAQNDFDKAAAILKELLLIIPEHPSVLNDLAVVKAQQGRLEEALGFLDKVIFLDPNNRISKENTDVILKRLGHPEEVNRKHERQGQSINVGSTIEDAERLIQARKYDEAEAGLKRLLSSFPFNVDALNDLAVINILRGRVEEAVTILQKVLEIDSQNQTALNNLKIVKNALVNSNSAAPDSGRGAAQPFRTEASDKQEIERMEGVDLPLVSVVIPVYNQLHFTKRCVEALFRNTRYPNYEVVFIDNASTDGTSGYLDDLTAQHSRARVIHSAENLGFVKGCNLAAGISKGKYVLFLNNDTEVQPGWLSSLVEFAETHENFGAVGSKLVYPDGTLQEAGGIIFSDGGGWNFGRGGDPNNPDCNHAAEVDYCSGASLLVRADLFSKYGGFDERYSPAYSEDADLCFTLRKDGYRVFYDPKSVVIHYESATSGKDIKSGFKRYLEINRKKFVEKWKEELLKQDEPPYENRFMPATCDRSRLLDCTGQNKYAYRKNYAFTGLPNRSDKALPYYSTLVAGSYSDIPVNLLYDPDFLLELADLYGLPWLYGRAYLEGRMLLVSEREMSKSVNDDVRKDLAEAGQIVTLLEARQESLLKGILTLELQPEPLRSRLSVNFGAATLVGTSALKELYKIVVKYAVLRGVLDVANGRTEDEGMGALENTIERCYASNVQLPTYMNKPARLVRTFSYETEDEDKKRRVRVLCFYPHNPYPPRTGADHGFMGVLDALQELGCEVHLLSSTYFSDKPWKVRSIEKFCKEKNIVLHVHQADEEDHIQMLVLRSLGPSERWDMKIPDNLHTAFTQVYNAVSPDMILINYAWWGKLVDDIEPVNAVKILQMHDLLSLNDKMQAAAVSLVGQPPYTTKKVKPEALIEDVFARLELTGDRDEYEIYDRYDYVLAVSEREREKIKANAPHTETILIPAPLGNRNTVQQNSYSGHPLFAIANNVFNVQAYLYFVVKVLPIIRKEIPDFQLNVVGDGCKVLERAEGINLLGFVDDIGALYQDTPFTIAPMIGGTGQSVKILEAMANGLPVVSLKNSYQTSSIRHGENGFLAYNAKEFAEYTIRLYRDRNLCRKLGDNARDTIRREFSHQKVVDGMQTIVNSVQERKLHGAMSRKNVKHITNPVAGQVSANIPPDEIIRPYIEKEEDNFVFISDSIFNQSNTNLFNIMDEFFKSLPGFFVHFGGIGDACLLLSTFYDNEPEQIIVSFGNSKKTMERFFRSFDELNKVYLMSAPNNPGVHQLLRFMIHRTRKSKGMGTTPLYDYASEWNSNTDIFEKYGIKTSPRWVSQFKSPKIQDIQVTIQPKGSLRGMVASKQNIIDRKHWNLLVDFLRKCGISPILIGTPDERKEYPELGSCIDERSYDLRRQMELVASSDIVIGADSWAKTFSGLCSIPTIVFRTVRGRELENWDDPADNVFIKPWKSITVANDMRDFEREFSEMLGDLNKDMETCITPGEIEPEPYPTRAVKNQKLSVAQGRMPVASYRASPSDPDKGADGSSKSKLIVTWEGSQFVHHSMALINREITLQLFERGHDVSIIPYEKDEYSHRVDKRFSQIASRTNRKHTGPVDVHVRHQWPPNLIAPPEGHWVMIQPWEFGSLPKEWIALMNKSVDEVWVPTSFVRDCYVKSGLDPQRIFVVPNGVNHKRFNPDTKPFPLKTKKKFKFLFVGGTIPRKGIDILVNTYLKTFSRSDDVCLVIKDLLGDSFYKGQTVQTDLERISADPAYPEIEYINKKLTEQEIARLYPSADCLVHPYRGEGFGLPIAEAMASELPVIVTNYGAALDFCSEDNSYLIPAKVVYYDEKKIGNRETVDFPWLAEPDPNALGELMRRVMDLRDEAKGKAKRGRDLIVSRFNWESVGKIVEERLLELSRKPIRRMNASADSDFSRDYKRAHELIEAGDMGGAARLLEKLLNANPDNADAANDLAVTLAVQGKNNDAEKVLDRLLNRFPENLVAKKNLAAIYSNQNRIEEAMNCYNDVIKSSPFDTEALNSIGQLCLRIGQVEQARELFTMVLNREPQNKQAKLLLDSIESMLEPSVLRTGK